MRCRRNINIKFLTYFNVLSGGGKWVLWAERGGGEDGNVDTATRAVGNMLQEFASRCASIVGCCMGWQSFRFMADCLRGSQRLFIVAIPGRQRRVLVAVAVVAVVADLALFARSAVQFCMFAAVRCKLHVARCCPLPVACCKLPVDRCRCRLRRWLQESSAANLFSNMANLHVSHSTRQQREREGEWEREVGGRQGGVREAHCRRS